MRPGPLGGGGYAFLVVVGASAIWAPNILDALDDYVHLLILAMVFRLGASVDDLSGAWKGLAAGVSVSAVLALFQLGGYTGIEQVVPTAGLFMNKNLLAEAGLVSIAAVGVSWWAIGPVVALIVGWSKASLAALAMISALSLWDCGRRVLALSLFLVIAMLTAWFFSSDYPSAAIRIDFWAEALGELTPMGNGIGSYATHHPEIVHPHSEPILILYELGVFAVLPLAFIVWLFRGGLNAERYILAAVLAVSFFSFPLHIALTGFVFALAAGRLARLRVDVRSPERVGGVAGGAVGEDAHRVSRSAAQPIA